MFQEGNSLLHLYGMNRYYSRIPISMSVKISVLEYLLSLNLSLEAENDVSRHQRKTISLN